MTAETPAQPEQGRSGGTRLVLALLPLVIFAALAAVFFSQLRSGKDISEIPSALIGTKAPLLDMPPLAGAMFGTTPMPALTDAAIKGRLTLVNVWASWCIPCREENPIILDLAKDERLTVVGINYKDETANALRFLGELGNPFSAIGVDPRGKAAIDWGVYGIPESYLVDADGTIIYKRVGPFDQKSLQEGLLPAIEKAASESVRTLSHFEHSLRSMRRMEANLRKASAFLDRFSRSLASLRHRPSHAKVRSTTHRRGNNSKPLAASDRLTISVARPGLAFF